MKRGILPGIDAGRWYPGLSDCLIVALTEKRTDDEIHRFIDGLQDVVKHGVLSGMQ
jgi:glycine dehydrogenase subunit 1